MRRIARLLQAAAGVVLILIADILFGVWIGHVWLAVSWLALGAAAAILLLGMLATRRGRRTRRRSRFVRGVAFVGACAALGVAAWCVGRAWRPYEPLTLSDQSTCGSVLQPRRFPEDFFGDVTGFSASGARDDCADTIRSARGVGLALMLLGLELALYALARNAGTDGVPKEAEGTAPGLELPPGRRRVALVGLALALATVLLAAAFAARTADQVRAADAYDRELAPALAATLPVMLSSAKFALALSDLVPAVKGKFDWPKIDQVCREGATAEQQVAKSIAQARSRVSPELRQTFGDIDRSLGALVAGCSYWADKRDVEAFRHHVAPLTIQASEDFKRLDGLTTLR